jgi:hypothetical protein
VIENGEKSKCINQEKLKMKLQLIKLKMKEKNDKINTLEQLVNNQNKRIQELEQILLKQNENMKILINFHQNSVKKQETKITQLSITLKLRENFDFSINTKFEKKISQQKDMFFTPRTHSNENQLAPKRFGVVYHVINFLF